MKKPKYSLEPEYRAEKAEVDRRRAAGLQFWRAVERERAKVNNKYGIRRRAAGLQFRQAVEWERAKVNNKYGTMSEEETRAFIADKIARKRVRG